MKRDYYEVLGLKKGAADHEIKSAFRRLAKEFHPDKESGRHHSRSQFQRGQRGLRGAEGPAETRGLRSVRPRRFRWIDGTQWRWLRVRQRLFGLDVGDIRRPVRRVHGRPPQPRTRRQGARLRSQIQHGNYAWRRVHRQGRANPRPRLGDLRSLRRRGRGSGLQPHHLPDLPRLRQGAGQPGLFHHRANLHHLPGPRRDHSEAVPLLRRQRQGYARAHSVGEHSGRRRGTPRASGWRAKAKRASAADLPAISTSSCRSCPTTFSSATARTCSAACPSP